MTPLLVACCLQLNYLACCDCATFSERRRKTTVVPAQAGIHRHANLSHTILIALARHKRCMDSR
ncbi:MAG: hypothetical protein V4805_10340, partial [Pseudomonadota bacterium]